MQVLKHLELPPSFDPKFPMSVQLRNERLKLFPKKKYIEPVTTNDPLILAACNFLEKTFHEIALLKGTKITGRNYDLFAIVYYLKSRKICTLEYMRRYIFTERNILNYKRYFSETAKEQKYKDLFNYLDSIR